MVTDERYMNDLLIIIIYNVLCTIVNSNSNKKPITDCYLIFFFFMIYYTFKYYDIIY